MKVMILGLAWWTVIAGMAVSAAVQPDYSDTGVGCVMDCLGTIGPESQDDGDNGRSLQVAI